METDRCDPESRASARELAHRLRGLNLYLVGMMGSGKSSVGRPLAEALGYRFLDADAVLEQAAGQPIPEIFRRDGEAAFRDLETAVLNQLAGWHSLVVATGGGVVVRPENWGHLRQGVVIWLDAPQDVLLRRLRADPTPRPLLAESDLSARLASLLEARRPLYAQADLTITQGEEAAEQVAARVLEALPTILREPQAAPEQPVELVDGEGRTLQDLNAPVRPDGTAAPGAPRTTGS
jgi:shikimate kinase